MKEIKIENKPLKKWLLFAVFHALIPLVALSFYSYLGQRERTIASAKTDAEYVSKAAASIYQEKIKATKSILKATSRLPEITGNQTEPCNRLLGDLLKEFPSYADFGVANDDGFIYCSGLPFTQQVDVKDVSWYKETLENGDFSAGLYQIGKITREESVNFGYPIALAYPLEENGKPSKVLFTALKLDWLKDTADNFHLPEGSTITVMDREGTILSHFPYGASFVGTVQKDNPLVKKILEGSEKGSTLEKGFDGIERYYSYVKVQETLSNAEFFVYIGIPKSVLTQAANRTFVIDFAMILGVIALTVVIVIVDWKKFIDKESSSS